MDILVEDGTGRVTANSYASTDEVDDILSINIHSKWALLDDATKENLCMWATRLLDQRAKWAGRKMYASSGLAWPRVGVRDKEGFPVDDNVVPRAVKVAVATLAEHLIAGNPELVNSQQNITALKADVVEIEFDSAITPDRYPSELKFILAGLASLSMGSGGPKRIIKH